MKKIVFVGVGLFLLAGCSSAKNASDISSEDQTSASISSTTVSTSTSDSVENKSIITKLNDSGEIKSDDKVMYTLKVTDVKDVTDEAKETTVNNTNALDYFSNGQGVQAVEITILMENTSGEELGMPYLDDAKVVDAAGVTNLGGWKEESGSLGSFGSYTLDSDGNADSTIYGIQDGESRMATSVVTLANNSDKVKFEFVSNKYEDSVEFELPVN